MFKELTLILLVILSGTLAAQVQETRSGVGHKINLTKLEKEWVIKNPVIDFTGDPNWLPFEAFDLKGQYVGIVADHLKLIEGYTDLKFNRVVTKSWTESTNKAKNKSVAVLSETDDSALKSHLNFTDSYLTNSIVIAMRLDNNYTENINSINKKRIALIKDYGYATKIRKKYSKIDFITVDDINDGLTSVSTGKVDALLCTLALCSYTITQLGISNVKITGKTEFDTKLAFGVQKDLPELLSILNKAIDHISKKEQQKVLQKWITSDRGEVVNYTLVYQILSVSVFFILFILFWNRRLSREVDARKEVEQILEEQQVQLKELLKGQKETINLLFNNSPFGFHFCDMSGLMIDANTEFLRITGYELEELKKVTYWELTPDKYQDEEKEQLRLLDEIGSYGPYRKEYIRKDGSLIPIELKGFITENYNGTKGILSLAEDITEKLAADSKIEAQREKLIRASKLATIGEMAAGVGHEINNPLAIAAGNISLIKKRLDIDNINNENLNRYLDCVIYANERIRKIVKGLKLYSRLDTSDYESISVKNTITDILDLTSEIYEKDGVHITFEDQSEELFINGSFGELQQIIVNLLSNAKDATKGLAKREIKILLSKKGSNAQISVKDNGCGIEKEIIDNIFNPFFTTKEPGEGTGLGMGIIYELVKKVGGDISVESSPNNGSNITISLPLIL